MTWPEVGEEHSKATESRHIILRQGKFIFLGKVRKILNDKTLPVVKGKSEILL